MFRSHLHLKPSPIIKREIKLDAAVGEGGGGWLTPSKLTSTYFDQKLQKAEQKIIIHVALNPEPPQS